LPVFTHEVDDLLGELETSGKIVKSRIDRKWELVRPRSGNSSDEKDQ
jgi:hypothetical protein